MQKNNDLKMLKKFSNISIQKISKKLNIDSSNVLSGRTSLENYKLIKEELEKELCLLFVDEKIKNVIIEYIKDIRKELYNLNFDENIFDLAVTYNKISYILDDMEKKFNE